MPVTVGIARTRTLAKLISDSAEPFGARAVLDADAEAGLLADLPVTEITGIAGRRAARLAPWGINTCLELAQADRRLVRGLLTASGDLLWQELNGDPAAPIHPQRPMHKSLSRGGSFGEASADPIILYAWLVRNLERLIEELHFHAVRAGRLTVWVGYKDGQGGLGQVHLPVPADRFDLLLDAARPCLRRAWRRGVRAERMQLIAEDLVSRRDAPLGLFDPPEARAAPRPSPWSSARSTTATADSPCAAPPRSRWPPSTATRPTDTTSATSGGRVASDDQPMCVAISLAWSELPTDLIGRHGLARRAHEGGGEPEIRFFYRDRVPRLPIWRDGRLQVVALGQRPGAEPIPAAHRLDLARDDRRGLLAAHRRDPRRHPGDLGPGARGLVSRPPGGPRAAGAGRAGDRRRLRDLHAVEPLLPRHDPQRPHARAHRGADLINAEAPRARSTS